MTQKQVGKNWYRLDNAALIYMPSRSRKWNQVYRVSVLLNEDVDPEILQSALNDIHPRFPTIMVYIRTGIFWNYFETAEKPPQVAEEKDFPCTPFDIRSRRYLLRVLYYRNRISFETFHTTTDGGGALFFLNTLLRRYFELKGYPVTGYEGCLDYLDIPTDEETRDDFQRFADGKIIRARKEKPAYQIKFKSPIPALYVTFGEMPIDEVKALSKKYNATIGQFLTALLFKTIKDYIEGLEIKARSKIKRPIKISVPVDLRRRFGSRTLRNFSSYINMEIPKEAATLEEIVDETKKQYELINPENIMGNINANIHDQNLFIVRIMPLVIKNLALKIAFSLLGDKLNTMPFSNFGVLAAPPEFSDYIKRYEFILGAQKSNALCVTCCAFNGKMTFTFTNKSKESIIERIFFRALSALGVNVTIGSNKPDCLMEEEATAEDSREEEQ